MGRCSYVREKWIMGLLVCGSWTPAADAVGPPPPKSLEDRVKLADYIFVGTAEHLHVVDETGKEVTPQPKVLALNTGLELSVEVHEVLYQVGNFKKNANLAPSYPWSLTESLESTNRIRALISNPVGRNVTTAGHKVTVRFGGGFFAVDDLREQWVGKRLVYLTKSLPSAAPVSVPLGAGKLPRAYVIGLSVALLAFLAVVVRLYAKRQKAHSADRQ